MYEELYSPIPDPDECLRRIGLEPAGVSADLPSLEKILGGWLANIPFENIDAYDEGKTPLLGVPQLYEKIVLHRRGGWCFELNGLLHALLVALGFCAYNVGVRVTFGGNDMALILHRGIVVELEGEKYYCDAGFGTLAFLLPIPLSGAVTRAGYRIEKRDGFCHVLRCGRDKDEELLCFEDRPYQPRDFVVANFFTSQNTETPFRKRRSISIQKGSLRRQLVDNTMKEYLDGGLVRTVTAASAAELEALLDECFGIEYKFS